MDAMCVMHSFTSKTDSSVGALMSQLTGACAPLCMPDGTLVIVFDRQASSPVQKHHAQSKRRKVVHAWEVSEVESLLRERRLPAGDGWQVGTARPPLAPFRVSSCPRTPRGRRTCSPVGMFAPRLWSFCAMSC